MLLTCEGITTVDAGFQRWENDKAVFYWKGFVYIQGVLAGLPSVRHFAKFFTEATLDQDALQLKGSYMIVMKVKASPLYYCFVDSSGCHDAFYSEDAISSSFLTLAAHKNMNITTMNRQAMMEFLNFGHLFENKTFFESIRKIDSSELLVFDRRTVKVRRKKLATIYDEEQPVADFHDFFQKLSQSLRNQRVSVDLSGGIDSRLISVLLHYYGVNFETTISGREGIQDVDIPKEVAGLFGVSLHVTTPVVLHLEEEIGELFRISDGMHDLFRHYRTMQHNRNRVQRGMNVAITGIGGEMFKDFFWLQDFPFYTNKKANLSRLFHTRFLPVSCAQYYFDESFVPLQKSFTGKMIDELAPYVLETNTKTYDNIYYHYRMKSIAGKYLTAANYVLPTYAPLLDEELVRFGFQLTRKERIFNRFHRKTITQLNPEVSKVRTSEGGISVSTQRLEVAKDIRKYVVSYTKRLMGMLGRKVLKKSYSSESPEHPELFTVIRQLRHTHHSINLLKEVHILHHDLRIDQIHNQHLGNLISLATLISYLETTKAGPLGQYTSTARR
ncbi:asparagine synthase-related protein [Brevibacillus choshinensis]|uniref:Asparagine synthetase domain-containing protein n=1 Tax=Brevibacillus choshinensis TaxID=54911 RepID=A0ABX7FK42_BRECH|nr:asparagine synthase-related protein [Brevibacillus choshinensis]QRG66225.1 hypothetical protein JNE38_22145 [Brevibacillus choshinensis]